MFAEFDEVLRTGLAVGFTLVAAAFGVGVVLSVIAGIAALIRTVWSNL